MYMSLSKLYHSSLTRNFINKKYVAFSTFPQIRLGSLFDNSKNSGLETLRCFEGGPSNQESIFVTDVMFKIKNFSCSLKACYSNMCYLETYIKKYIFYWIQVLSIKSTSPILLLYCLITLGCRTLILILQTKYVINTG